MDLAQRQIVKQHMPVAARIAGAVARRIPSWRRSEDLQSAAMLGLVEAATRFDAERGEPFVAFAERRIRGAVLDELRRGDPLTRRARRDARQVAETIADLEQELGHAPDDCAVAERMGVDLDTYRATLETLTQVSVVELGPVLIANLRSDDDPEAAALRASLIARVRAALPSLPARELQLLAFYYVEGLPYAEIGRRMGVTESRVCQLHGRAIAVLRSACASR